MPKDSRIIQIGQDGAKSLFYGTFCEANVKNNQGIQYTVDVLAAAVNSFITNNPSFTIKERDFLVAIIYNISIQDNKALMQAEVLNTTTSQFLASLINKGNLYLMFEPIIAFPKPDSNGYVSSFEITDFRITRITNF